MIRLQAKKPINVRVGGNIQQLREERHYTQEELSEKIGVTPNHLSDIERGVSGISLELLEKLWAGGQAPWKVWD